MQSDQTQDGAAGQRYSLQRTRHMRRFWPWDNEGACWVSNDDVIDALNDRNAIAAKLAQAEARCAELARVQDRAEHLVVVAEDVSRWMESTQLADTGHHRCLKNALGEYHSTDPHRYDPPAAQPVSHTSDDTGKCAGMSGDARETQPAPSTRVTPEPDAETRARVEAALDSMPNPDPPRHIHRHNPNIIYGQPAPSTAECATEGKDG